MEVKLIMFSRTALPWRTAVVCLVPAAVAAASLLVGGLPSSWGKPPEVIDPSAAITTTTRLAVPAVSSGPRSGAMLIATITPAAAAGTVQFIDNGPNLGAPVRVADGTAAAAEALAPGSHQLTAVFTPVDGTSYTSSTSAPMVVVIPPSSGAAATNTTLTTSASEIGAGSPVTLTATTTPTTAAGTVQFRDGRTNLGSPVVVRNGTAAATATLIFGTHQLTATFIPDDPAAMSSSTSTVVPVVVTEPGQSVNAQQSGLSLDLRVSVPNDQPSDLDSEGGALETVQPDNRQPLVNGHLAVLGDRHLLGGVVTVVLR